MTNGEKYKTAKERTSAFEYYCEGQDTDCNGCPLSGNKKIHCRFAWLDLEAEAEEEKPMPCPFCGSEVKPRNTPASHNLVCDDCGYQSPYRARKSLSAFYEEDEAITAHNRICKAVAAYKESEVK